TRDPENSVDQRPRQAQGTRTTNLIASRPSHWTLNLPAVADLVDNSVDAGAKDVVIHFLRDSDHLVSLLVVDDGCGMDEEGLDVAMTVGGRRDYDAGALGMFGTGLKSASLSQAKSVTVISRTRRSRPTGRRWVMEHAKSDHRCDIVDAEYAQTLLDRYYDRPIIWQGTIVRWDGAKDFPKHGGGGQTDRYLNRIIAKLGLHLGLHPHRFLAREDFKHHHRGRGRANPHGIPGLRRATGLSRCVSGKR
ncbi:ATP-binding protein, partial [Kitasatospora aureofaciens]|uniref:ATP-binding protein n=1 Tax=Kitasatospora aureofaciens TaxID=1894 RepID=UPI001F2B946F